MSRKTRVLTLAGCLALVGGVVVTGLLLSGCEKSEKPEVPDAVVYMCTDTGELFGIPKDLRGADELFPPIVCPTTGKRTAVRAIFYRRKSDGKSELYKLEKYTDDEIRRMESIAKNIPPEMLNDVDPETEIGREGVAPLVKYPGEDKWLNSGGQDPRTRNPLKELKEMQAKYKSLLTVVPYDNPKWTKTYSRDELKQW